MIFPVYCTDLELPQPEAFIRTSYFSDHELQRFYGMQKLAGSIAVGSAVWSSLEAYSLGEVAAEPPIERVYDILSENIYVAQTQETDRDVDRYPDYDEMPMDLKARGQFNGIDVSIAGLYYKSNKYVGWMNIQPRIALFKTVSDEDQRKMLGL